MDLSLLSNNSTFTPHQLKALSIAAIASGGLSIIGSFFMIFSFLIFYRKLKAIFFRLVFMLCISDLAISVVLVFGASGLLKKGSLLPPKSNTCQIQGFCVQFLLQVANLYILMIALCLYRVIVSQKAHVNVIFEVCGHIFIWGYSAALAYLPLKEIGGMNYSNAGAWCWINEAPKYARFVMLYVCVWGIIIVIIVMNIIIWINFRSLYKFTLKSPNEATKKKFQNIYRRLFIYPLAFIILWTPSILNRVVQVFISELFVLNLLQAIFLPLQGFIDAIVYGFTSVLHEDYRKLFSAPESTTPLIYSTDQDNIVQ